VARVCASIRVRFAIVAKEADPPLAERTVPPDRAIEKLRKEFPMQKAPKTGDRETPLSDDRKAAAAAARTYEAPRIEKRERLAEVTAQVVGSAPT
jgi:hypothetical protein